ncbi:MAG: hypothetical protein U0667_06325 [Chloroflexota bacterium]
MKLKLLVAVAMFAIGFGAVGYVLFAPSSAGAATSTYLTATATTTDVTREAVAWGPSPPAIRPWPGLRSVPRRPSRRARPARAVPPA